MSEQTPTRRDRPRRTRATRRDEPDSRQAPPTRRDGTDEAPRYTDTGGLPEPVYAEYEPVPNGSLGAGGEAHLVMRVRRRSDDAERVVKVYRSTIRPDTELLEVLRAADPEHLVRIEDWGDHTDRYGTAQSWEILEYIEHGSLRTLIDRRGPKLPESLVRELLVELAGALTYLHTQVRYRGSTGLAHRDVKPANVLVRKRSNGKLDLVLCDFGLVAEIRATRMSSRRAGTATYQAPETWWAPSRDPAQDWWALGVMVVEMLTGQNPNTGPSGEEIDEKELFHTITRNRGVDLSGVTDPRWRMLCAGLLTMDPDYRWKGQQVDEWLNNGSPPVHENAPMSAEPPAPPIEVAGRPCRTPSEVATAMSTGFSAARDLFLDRDERLDLSDWLRTNFAQVEETIPKDVFRKDPADRWEAGSRVARFISYVAPELQPSYDGRPMDAAGIAALTAEATEDATAATLVDKLDVRLLTSFGRHYCVAHPTCRAEGGGCVVLTEAAGQIDSGRELLQAQMNRLNGQVPRLSNDDRRDAWIALVRVLVDPEYVERLRHRVGKRSTTGYPPWWTGLVQQGMAGTAPANLVALVIAGATDHHATQVAAARQAELDVQRAREKEERTTYLRGRRREQWATTRLVIRDVIGCVLGMCTLYTVIALAVLVTVMINDHPIAAPLLVSQIVALQTSLTIPGVVMMACVIVQPASQWRAAQNARAAAVLSGVAVVILLAGGRPELAVFPVQWSAGLHGLLTDLTSSYVGTGVVPVADRLLSTLFGGAVVLAFLLWVLGAFVRRRPQAYPSSGVRVTKRVLISVVIGLFALRAAQIWLGWDIPGLPTPTSVWMTI